MEMMNRVICFLALLFAAVSCTLYDYRQDDTESVVFSVREESGLQTKGGPASAAGRDSAFRVFYDNTKVTAVTQSNLSGFYLNTTRGDSQTVVSCNVPFSKVSGSVFSGDLYWPSSNQDYHFYASNVRMLEGTDCSKVACPADTDVIYAYLASPAYRSSNNLAFRHVYARIGSLTLNPPSGMSVTLKSASIRARRSGTFDIKTGSWSSVAAEENIPLSSSNDIWVVPGSYYVRVTYDISNSLVSKQDQVLDGYVALEGNLISGIAADVTFEDYILYTNYSISPISLSKSYFTPEGGTATISGGECKITYTWASGRTTYGTFTPEKYTNNSWSSVSGNTLTVSPFDDGTTHNVFVYYHCPYAIIGDSEAYYTMVGTSSLQASVSKSKIYYGQSTTVSVTANYSDGSSADVTGSSTLSVPYAGSYTSVSGTTYTHNRSGLTTDYTLNGTASYGCRSASFSFTAGQRCYDLIEVVAGSDGRTSTKPSFRARWIDTKGYDSLVNGSCDYWTVDGTRIDAGVEAEAKNFSSGDHTFTIYFTSQSGAVLQASRSVTVSGNKWYYN